MIILPFKQFNLTHSHGPLCGRVLDVLCSGHGPQLSLQDNVFRSYSNRSDESKIQYKPICSFLFFLMVQMDLVEIANFSKVVYLVHTSNAKNPFLLYFSRSFHKMVFVYVPGERFALLPGHSFFFHEHVCSVAMETGPCQFN